MMKRTIYIFGHSAFSEVIASYLKDDPKVMFGGFIVDDAYYDETINNSTVQSWSKFISSTSPEQGEIIVAVGYSNMNQSRENIFKAIRDKKYVIASYFHPTSIISKDATLGDGCIVLENVVIQPFVECGEGNIFWSNVNVCHHTRIGNFNFFAASSCILGKITIDNNCFIGSNASIKNRVHLASKTLVGACAFVRKDTNVEEIVVPAESITLSKKSGELKI